MIPQVVTVGALAVASSNNISLSQTPGAAGNLVLNGTTVASGVATLDVPRRVLITSAGNDSARTFTVTGTNHTGNPIKEAVTGGNVAGVSTVSDFKTVTRIAVDAATAAAVTAGTNGVASSPWKFTSIHFGPANMSFAVIVSGTVNYSIEYTYDNPNSNQNTLGGALGNYPAVPNVFLHPILQNLATSADSTINDPIFAWRLTLNSQTNPGFATATNIQSGTTNQAA